jgi:alanine racemase
MPNKEMRYYRPTWAEIDLNNLAHNFRQVKKMLAPATKVMVTVKADAYGHGLIPVSKKLVSCGVDHLGVASIDEGISLRKSGIRKPILVLGPVLKKDILPLFQYRLAATVCDEESVEALNRKARSLGQDLDIHIKIDTGMGRIGVPCPQALEFIRKVRQCKGLRLQGLFTHFALADTDKDYTRRQAKLFNRIAQESEKEGLRIPLLHAANSMGVLNFKEAHFNMVRPGLVIYGLYPKQGLKISLKPVLSLKTRVIFVKDLPSGCGISYGHSYVTKRSTRVATLPIGYGDGYPRLLSNQAPVLIKGRLFKVCGRICMDQMMVDVGDLSLKTGEVVVLIGSQGKRRISVEELAVLSQTIPYEIVCGLGSRIPRVYIG